MTSIDAVLTFWFGDPTGAITQRRKEWFQKDPEFDQCIRDRFLATYEQAAAGQCDRWATTAPGALALILVLDQFPRNLFRQQPQAFATDAKALAVAQAAIAQGWDQDLLPLPRCFVYMPLMHSEARAIQAQAVQLFQPLTAIPATEDYYTYALRHQAVIEQFGRFPHRNAILGRPSTPAEVAFLQQPGSSF